MRARRFFLLLALAPLACGGAPAPPVQNAAVTPVASSTVVAAPVFDTSPVQMPANVVLVVRVANASASADKLSRWTRIPLSPLELFGNDRAARTIDLSKPVDLVVTMDDRRGRPNPNVAMSAAIRSLDEARSIIGEKNDLVPSENGVVKIVPRAASKADHGDKRSEEDDDDDDDDRRCALAPAFGTAPYRLVCAETEPALGKVLAYLTRGVTRIPLDQDVHVEAYAGPLKKFVNAVRGELMHDLNRGSNRVPAMADLLNAYDPFEAALDLDHATLDAKLDDAAGDAKLALVFREKQSAWTKALTSHPELAGPAPATFLRLPIESDVAFYSHGFDAAELDKARASGGDALAQGFLGDSMAPSDAQAFANAFKDTIGALSGPFVYARGVDVVQARAALSAFASAKDDASKQKASKAAIEQVAGWEVVGLEQPIAKVGPNLKGYAAAFARAGFTKWYKDHGDDAAAPVMKSAAAIAGLPPDSVHFEIAFTHPGELPAAPPPPPAPGTKSKPTARPAPKPPVVTKLHIIAIPDQGRTWIVDAMDEATATAKAKGLLPNAPDTGTLAKRADIDALKNKTSNAGGFFNVQGIGLDVPLAWARRTPAYELAGDDPLGGMTTPTQGATAIPFVFTEQAPPANMAGMLVLSARIPKEAITDGLTYGTKLF